MLGTVGECSAGGLWDYLWFIPSSELHLCFNTVELVSCLKKPEKLPYVSPQYCIGIESQIHLLYPPQGHPWIGMLHDPKNFWKIWFVLWYKCSNQINKHFQLQTNYVWIKPLHHHFAQDFQNKHTWWIEICYYFLSLSSPWENYTFRVPRGNFTKFCLIILFGSISIVKGTFFFLRH